MIIYDVPLLVEAGRASEFDAVIVVEASDEVRLARLIEERKMTEEAARARMSAQATNAERRAVADYVISTETGIDDTRREASVVYQALRNASVD